MEFKKAPALLSSNQNRANHHLANDANFSFDQQRGGAGEELNEKDSRAASEPDTKKNPQASIKIKSAPLNDDEQLDESLLMRKS